MKKLCVSVYYEHGGVDYFGSGRPRKRGYWISATPKEFEEPSRGVRFVKTTAFSGTVALLEETKRFSQKRLEAVATGIRSHEMYARVIDATVQKNGFKLKEASRA